MLRNHPNFYRFILCLTFPFTYHEFFLEEYLGTKKKILVKSNNCSSKCIVQTEQKSNLFEFCFVQFWLFKKFCFLLLTNRDDILYKVKNVFFF